MNSLAQLTDASLHSELKRLVGGSNALTAQLLAHLGEVEARGIHRERACSSLYTYCVYELRMSEDEAQRRCRAARLARQFPILLDMLAEASLHLTGILLIGPHLTEENQVELLARARFRTKREIERLVAEIAPCPDVPSRIVPLHRAGAADTVVAPLEEEKPGLLARPRNSWAAYVRSLAGPVREMQAGLAAGQAPPRAWDEEGDAMTRGASSGASSDLECGTPRPNSDRMDGLRTSAAPAFGDRADDVRAGTRTAEIERSDGARAPALARESEQTAPVPPPPALRYKVQFTADQAYVDLLEEARDLLQHELPARDLVEVQRRALGLLVRKLRQRKYAASERPRRTGAQPVHEDSHAEPTSTDARHEASRSESRSTGAPPSAAVSAARAGHAAAKSTVPRARHSGPKSVTPGRHAVPHSSQHSRYIPAEARRSVWRRDEARCTYVDARGQRCREQSGLEFHHRQPHGRGGPPTIDNLALRCRSHNDLAAEQDFGRDFMRQKRRAAAAQSIRAGAAP